MRNDLVSSITHGLKTPITTVGVALEALQNFHASADRKKTTEYLNVAKRELDRLSLLVETVLITSITDEKSLVLNKEPVDLEALLAHIVNSLQLQFQEKNATVQVTRSPGR